MLAPVTILHDAPALLGDLRLALSLRPELADFPRRLAAYIEAEEQDVRQCLEVLHLEGPLCP